MTRFMAVAFLTLSIGRRPNVRRASLLYEPVVLGVVRATCYVLRRNKAYTRKATA